MQKEDALNILRLMGYKAELEDGVVMIQIACNGVADFQRKFIRARLELEKAGYRGSIGAREVREDATS